MIELRGNIWELAGPDDLIVLTTNGYIKKDGSCVMGRGIALQAKNRYPGIDRILAQNIRLNGNIVQFLNDRVIAFPVKPISKVCESHTDYVSHMKFKIGDTIPGWACRSKLHYIVPSLNQLVELLRYNARDVYIGRMGCGAGELRWEDVRNSAETILIDDKFKVCTF